MINPLALKDDVSQQAERDMVFLGGRGVLNGLRPPMVTRLTALETQLTFEHPVHLLHLLPQSVQTPHLLGFQGQSVGGEILAAVSRHEYFETSGQTTNVMPIRVGTETLERLAIQASIVFQLANEVPSIILETLQQPMRRIPGIKDHKFRLTLQPVAGIAEEFQRQIDFGRAALVPDPEAQRNAPEAIGPDGSRDLILYTRARSGRRL